MNKLFAYSIVILSFAFNSLFAQTVNSATNLPNISLIGTFLGVHSETENSFDVKEIEIAFQNYLYPSIKADVFTAIHKEDSGERNLELEEAYLTFFDVYGLLVPNTERQTGLGAIAGKKLLGIGKTNSLHPEQLDFVDRPMVIQQFYGGQEGLSAEGAQLNYILPLPFFSQVEIGYWTANTGHSHEEEELDEEHEENEEEHHEHSIEYSNRILSSRLWNSFALSSYEELQFGINYLLGNASSSIENEQQQSYGTDITYTKTFANNNNKLLKIQSEYFLAKYGEEGESRETQSGYYISSNYKFNRFYSVGTRFGHLGQHGNEGEMKDQWSFLLNRQLTETTKFRFQYNTGEGVENTFYIQLIFGMGPHSHVLQ